MLFIEIFMMVNSTHVSLQLEFVGEHVAVSDRSDVVSGVVVTVNQKKLRRRCSKRCSCDELTEWSGQRIEC